MRLVYHVLNGAGEYRSLGQKALLDTISAERMGKVATASRYVWVILALTAVDGVCHLNQKEIAAQAGLSVQTIARYISELERFGFVKTHKA